MNFSFRGALGSFAQVRDERGATIDEVGDIENGEELVAMPEGGARVAPAGETGFVSEDQVVEQQVRSRGGGGRWV